MSAPTASAPTASAPTIARHRGSGPTRRGRPRAVARLLAVAAAAAGALVVAPAPSALAVCPTGDQCTSLPNVRVRDVLLAAMLDPYRKDSVTTAHDQVLRVENALVAKGFLPAKSADGYWGTVTTAAWASFEKAQGESGVATRNGLPSPAELRAIGRGRFDVVGSYDVGQRITLAKAPGGLSNDGTDVVNARTRAMFVEARRLLSARGQAKAATMIITQGGYCGAGCASTSYGTHDGGGIIDVRITDYYPANQAVIDQRLTALRDVGFAAWQRSNHIHAVALGDYQMAWTVHGDTTPPPDVLDQGYPRGYCQVYEWVFRKDGLGNCDDIVASSAPHRTVVTWEDYLAARG